MKNQSVTEEIRDTLQRILRARRWQEDKIHQEKNTINHKGTYYEFGYNGP